MSTKGENERIAVVETKVEGVRGDLARVEKKCDDGFTRIADKLDEISSGFVSRSEFVELVQRVTTQEKRVTLKMAIAYGTGVIGLITAAVALYALFRG